MERESLCFPRVHSCKDPTLQVHDGRDVVSRHPPYEGTGFLTGHKLTSLVRAAKGSRLVCTTMRKTDPPPRTFLDNTDGNKVAAGR